MTFVGLAPGVGNMTVDEGQLFAGERGCYYTAECGYVPDMEHLSLRLRSVGGLMCVW